MTKDPVVRHETALAIINEECARVRQEFFDEQSCENPSEALTSFLETDAKALMRLSNTLSCKDTKAVDAILDGFLFRKTTLQTMLKAEPVVA
jgi:hypothetical protein